MMNYDNALNHIFGISTRHLISLKSEKKYFFKNLKKACGQEQINAP